MNDNDIITLAPNVTIKYIDNILVVGKNYYKYEAKVNDKQKNLYLNKKIGNDSKQKNAVYNFILNNENNDSADIFLDLDIKDEVNSTDFGGNGGDISVQKSRNQNPKLSENWRDYIDNALISIRNTSNCSIGVIENFFNKESSISGKYKYIDDNMAESKNLYNKMLNSGKGGSGDLSGMVTNYRDAFNDIAYGILEMYDAAQTEAINNDELKMMDDKSKEYFGTESFNNEFKDILSNSKLELKKTNNNFLFKDMFKEIGALQAKYSVASLSENESIFKSISNSIDDNIDEDMKGKVAELVKFMAGFLGISELEARKAIKENPIEMANQLYDAQMSIAENVKNGGSGYDAPEISTSFWEFKDAFYSTDAGKEALFNRFLNSDSNAEGEFPKNITPYDEKNSIAYTNYITYCMQIGKLNWLMDSCKEFPVVIDKINNNDVFTVPEEVTDTNTLSYIAKNIEDYNVAPFGYVKKGDKWYQVNYNKRGQDMLYYMDYHCGENSGNSGDDRVITAFSNQGRVDSVERNYKGLWIDSHLNGDYDKNSSEYKSAERDYYVLNGVIEDKQRYNELTESGELSFKDLVTFSKIETDGTDKLTDINYINEHKDEIKAELGLSDKQLYNFSVLFSKDGINTGDIVLDPMLEATKIALSTIGSAGVQIFGGLLKFGENVGDAVNTAIHSDFILGSVEYDYTNWDGTGEPDATYDLTKEFKEFRDSTWDDFYNSDKYSKEYSSFKNSAAGIRQLESKLYNDYFQFNENTDGYYYINGKVYKSVDEIPDYVKENAFADLFKQNKLTEWNLHDSSSSNYYLAAFKEGIREGGNFTRFDNLNYNIVENARMQFNTQDDVELDKTGEWMQSKIYDTDFYKNMEDYSFVKKDNILGMVFNQVGNMAVPIAISMIPGMFTVSSSALGTAVASSAQVFQGLSSAALFTSAFGGAAEEAFISGASYNEALKYATLSATTELAIEHLFSGIGGYGEGWLDDALEYLPNKYFASKGLDTNLTAQTLKTLITGGLGEAVEEVTTDFVTPLWQSMTYMNDKTYYDVLNENVSLESLAQTALVSFLSSMIFKGVEINQQTSAFNKNLTNLQNRISTISDINLDTNVLETQAKKVLAQYIGEIIENEGVIKSGLLEQLIKNTSNQLVSDPKSREQLSKLQDELTSFKNQNVTLGEGKNSINLTGSELLRLEDLTGFDGKYSVEDGKIKFENEQTQSRFNSSVLKLAQTQADNYNASLKELISDFENSREKSNTKNLQDAINSIIQYGNIEGADLTDLVSFEYGDSMVVIPKEIAQKVSTELSIEEGKITFKKDMTSSKFIDALYKKAINLCNDQVGKTSYDIKKTVDKGLINKAIDIIKPSLESQIANILVTNVTPGLENNLTKIDVETTINGEQRNISIYVDGNTDSSVYKQSNKLTELIQKAIMKNENSDLNNIYLGELVYDSKEKVINSVQNKNNQLYVNSLELENAKKNGSIHSLQSAIFTLMKNNNEFVNSSFVKITHDGVTVIIPESILKEITNKYKIIDGNVKFNQDMNIDKFIIEVYDKALDINKQTMEAIENTKVKNSTYVNTDGMDLYRLEVETVIDGETRTVNVYVDGSTNISSIKDSTKISQMLYQLLYENKNSNNIYVGQIVYDEKTGKINISENTANKLYVDSINEMSETDEHSEVVTSEEVIETTNEEVTPSEEIKKGESYEYTIEKESEGESYEYTIEEVKEDNSNATPKDQTETVTNENRTKVGSESVITNVAQAASVGVTAGATSQAIYQNNAEVTTRNTESQTKGKNVQSNTQNKENTRVETKNNKVISISEIKSQVNSYIDSIKTECEKYIELHQNDENFVHRFEQFKKDKIVQLNDKLAEIRKAITDSNSAELNNINLKIDSLSENDSLRSELISQRDKLIEKQQQELADIATSANEKLQKVLTEYIKTGNINVITRTDNARGIVSNTFDIVIDGKVSASLNLEELISNDKKIAACLCSMEETQLDEFYSAIVNYIDYVKKNNIEVEIDSNVMKFYESYKYAKENNVFIVNESRILEKGADMIAISQEFNNKYKNDIIYQEVIDTIINGVESLNLFEEFISKHYSYNDVYMAYMNDVIRNIDSSIKTNENFKTIYNDISKLNEHSMNDTIQRLISQNQELREQYAENFEKFKDIYDNSYVLKNSLAIVPKMFNGYYTALIDTILNEPNFINVYSIDERQKLVNTINDFVEYLKNNNIEFEFSNYAESLEFLNRKVPNIDSNIAIKSKIAGEFELSEKHGGSYGPDQGIIKKLFKKVNMNTVIESLFGNNIKTEDFLEVLSQMDISEKDFKKHLVRINKGRIFTRNTTEMKIIDSLASQVIKNYPGMSKKDAIQFLYLMETKEAGGIGICNYASMTALIFDMYKENAKLFEQNFGYPMYVMIDGKKQLNTATLLVDMYSIINDGVLVRKTGNQYLLETNNSNYLNLANDDGTIATEYFQKFLDKKRISMDISKTFAYSSNKNLMHYEEIITNIHDALARGEHVHIAAWNFDIYRPNGELAREDVGGHIMSVLEITEDGHLIVDSWGERLMIDLKTQMSKLGNYNPNTNICIVSYDISLDKDSNVSTGLDIKTDVSNERNTHNSAYTEVFDVPSDSIKSNVTSSIVTDEDLEFIDEGINAKGVEAPKASVQDLPSNVNIINIDGVEITVETLKELQTPSNLETALKTGEYAGVRVERALVELSKLDGVTLDSKLQKLVKISETLRQDEIIFNIEDLYSNGGTANIINIDVYKEFMKLNPNSSISLDNLYKIINSNGDIYKLISNDTIIKNVSNESIKESLSYLVSISNRYNYENKVIRETHYLLNLLEDNYTTEELYDAFAIAHTEFNTPDVYYECSNYLKTMDVNSAVKLLESKGYTTLDITDAFLNLAIRMDSQELSKKYYYKAFDYLVENGMDEKEAATIIRDKYRTLINRRGTRVVTTTPNGVKIKIVNNISTNNKLFTIEKIESMIKQAEKYYSKTGLKEIVIFDSFAPHNIYSEKVQYEDYVKTHNNRRFVAAASATKSSIILWEDFDKLDSIVHEYGHTIDKHIKLVNKLATDFSSSSTWLEAIQKDAVITSKRVSEYAYASNGEDFAEFLKYFNRNSLEVARKYPNRYKAASKYLNLDIDSNIIERYLDSKQFFIEGIEDLSNLLTEDGTMLDFIKQYAFENLKGYNSIAKTVIYELDSIYESRMEIMDSYGVYSIFMDMREQERIGSNEFLKIIKDYLDGKDISSKFKDARNLEIIKLLENEEIQEWYEEELNEMTAETEKIPVSDEDFEKMMNSLFNDSDSNSSSDTSIINDENTDIIYDSEVVDVNDEINKILKGDVYLKRFIMSKDTSLAKSISDLIKSDNVDLSSPIGIKLQQIVDTVVNNGHVINLDAFVYGTESPIVVSNEVYTEYQRINPGKSIKDLYKIVKENSLYEKLTGKERNMYIKSIDTLLGLSNDKNMLINELEVISKALKEEPSTAFDIISKYHMEAKLPQGYSEYSDLLKSGVSINETISQLERLGYSYSEISYIVMSEAMITYNSDIVVTYNSDIVEKSYYDMFEYLKEKFIEENPKGIKKEQELIKYAEEEAAKKVRKNLTELFQIRGSKPVLVTSSGVEIRVVNNAQIDSTFIENISEQLSKIENIYGRSALETIVIYDTISPENLTNEIINYPKYREKFPNKHFMTQANATRTNINIYNSFNSLDTLSHEYGHTLDKGPLSTRVYNEKTRTFKTILFSESDAWQRAVKIDKKSVSSYGDLKLEEDFADFIKAYTKNPAATMLRYPNRYLEMSSKLGIKIDGKAISEYMSNTRLIDVLNSISNILETSTLDVIKEYVFNGQIDNNGYTFIDDILKDIRYDTLLDTIDASSVINEIQKSYNLTDEKVTFLLEQIIRGNSISDLLSESDIKLIEMLDDEGLRETYRDYLELNDVSTKDQIIEDADVDMSFPKKSIFSKKIETVSVSDIPRVFRNMNTTDIISILEGKTTLKNDENYINNKKSIIRFVKYLSENNIKLSLNERANTIIENLRNGDFRLNILNFSDVLNGDTPIYGPSSINLDGIKISTDDVMAYLENKKNEISSIITSDTPNEDARDLLNAIDELGSKNHIIYDKYRKSIKMLERIERSYVYRSYDSYYLLPKSFNGIETSRILNSDTLALTSYINSLSNADKKAYRVALDEFGKYIYKTNTKLSRRDLSRVNRLYDVINTKKFSPDTVIKSKVYDTFEMSYQNDGEFGSNQGKVREVIEKLGITNVIESLFDEKVERSKFLQTLSEFNISERDFITTLTKKTQIGIMNNLFKDGDINLELYSSLIKQVKINYPNMSTMEAVRFLYLIETKEAGGPGICNNPIFVNMIFDRYIGREMEFERDFGYPMYITSNNGKKVLNEARLLVDIYSTLNDGVLVHNINEKYMIQTTNVNYVRTYDLNGLRLDAIEKFINKKGINLNVSKSYFFNSNEELMHYDYLMEQIKSELDKGNYVILGARGFDMDVENFEFREDCDAHGMTVVGIDTTGELILDSWGMKARVDLKKELSRVNELFKNSSDNMAERLFTISSYNIS